MDDLEDRWLLDARFRGHDKPIRHRRYDEGRTADVSYAGQFDDGVTDNAVKGRFTWLF